MPVDLAEALTGWLKPLRKIGVPVNDINMVVFIAMRFVPVLVEEFEIIRKAQTVRGVDFSGGLIKRTRKILYLLVPVLRSSLRRADELALAIESRGYVSGKDRTAYRQLVWREADIAFLSLGTAIFIALFVYLG
jgi:energy-coupling factor transport system permease protein